MTKREINEGNKLIDNFMQKVWDTKHPDYEKYSPILKARINNAINNPNEYNLSWDLLMPVCKKISEMRIIVNNSVTPMINEFRRMKKGAITFDIEETYLGVVSFINWYNKQQNGKKK